MRKISAAYFSTLLGLLLAPAAAYAQADPPTAAKTGLSGKSLEDLMDLEVETVYGASKHQQRVSEAPSSVTILTADDIRTFGWRTLAEALGSVRGFYTTYDRNYTYVGVRGFGRPSDYNNRVLVLVNGHRFNDNVYDQALVGTEFPIDLALVDRIEVIRGPGSALYGTSAFFAVINLVLRRGGAVKGGEADLEVGSASTYRLRGTYGTRTGSGHDLLLSVSHSTSDGASLLYYPEYDDPATGFGLSRHVDADESTAVTGTFGLGRLTLQGVYGRRSKVLPTGAYGTTLGDPRNRTIDSRGWLDATVAGSVHGTALTSRLFVDFTGYDGTYIFEQGTLVNRDTAHGVWVGGELLATRRVGSRQRVAAGVDYRANLRQDQRNWYVDPYLDLTNDRRRSQEIGVYVQDEIELHRRLVATVGGRYDWSSQGEGTGRPRVGLIYRTDADTAVKFLFGAAYRAPTVYERYYEPPPTGETLQPETVQTTELVYEQHVGGGLRITAAGYATQAKHLISQVEDNGLLYYRNQDRADSVGLELEAERRWTSGVLLRASHVIQKTSDPSSHVELSNSPRQLGLVHAAVPLLARRLTIALEEQFVGARLTYAGEETPSVWLTNVHVSLLPWRGRLTLAAHLTNLLNQRYAHPVGLEFRQQAIPQDGRAASVRAILRF